MEIKLEGKVYSTNRIFCIGKNYRSHALEMKEKVPDEPAVFMKPKSSILPLGESILYPEFSRSFQHEVEIVVLIGKSGRNIDRSIAERYVSGISLGLDLTLRDLQIKLKENRLPWEKSKAFDKSAPLGNFIVYPGDYDLGDLTFYCQVNGEIRQTGYSGDMIFPIPALISDLSRYWKLEPGDLIFTGTPAGIADLQPGDRIEISCQTIGKFSWDVTI